MPATAAQIELLAGLEQRRLAASRDCNLDELGRLLNDDFVFIHSNGRIDSRGSYLELLASGDLRYETMESFDLVVTSPGDDLATARSRVELVAIFKGNRVSVSALILAVWQRGRAGWQALSVQSTPIPQARRE